MEGRERENKHLQNSSTSLVQNQLQMSTMSKCILTIFSRKGLWPMTLEMLHANPSALLHMVSMHINTLKALRSPAISEHTLMVLSGVPSLLQHTSLFFT